MCFNVWFGNRKYNLVALNSSACFSRVCVARYLVFCVVFCRIVFVLRFKASDNPCGFFTFFLHYSKLLQFSSLNVAFHCDMSPVYHGNPFWNCMQRYNWDGMENNNTYVMVCLKWIHFHCSDLFLNMIYFQMSLKTISLICPFSFTEWN
jgi:hypothetical protein